MSSVPNRPPGTSFSATLSPILSPSLSLALSSQALGPLLSHPLLVTLIYLCHLLLPVTLMSAISGPVTFSPHHLSLSPPPTLSPPFPCHPDLVLSPLHSCYPFSAHHPLLVTLFLSLLLPTTSSTLSPLPTTPLTPFPLYPLPVPATCPLSAPSTPNPPCPCQPWPRPSPRAQRGYGAGGRGPGSVRSGPSPPPSGSPSRFSLFFYSNTQNGEWTCNSWSSQPISGHNPADRRHPKPIGFRSLVGSASQRRATLATTNRAHPAALGGGAKVQDRPPSGTDTNLSLRPPDQPRVLPYNK